MVTPRRAADQPAPKGDNQPQAARRASTSPWRRVVVVAAVLVLAWSTGALGAEYARTYALARQAAQLDQHRRDLVAANQVLRDEIGRLRTDDGYLEWLARKELGMVRPGEVEFLIVPAGTNGAGNGRSATGHPGPDPAQGSPSTELRDRTVRDPGAVTAPAPDPGTAQASAGAGAWVGRLLTRLASLLATLRL
ncbi:MAG TPA: septum formation initiator family protein [bacterium]|nr:septum formation initiator family protein [bacterium]